MHWEVTAQSSFHAMIPFSSGLQCLPEHFYNYIETNEKSLFQVFTANSDRGTIVSHKLWPQIFSRYVRFSVMSWYKYISMRVELYGCAN